MSKAGGKDNTCTETVERGDKKSGSRIFALLVQLGQTELFGDFDWNQSKEDGNAA